MGECPHGKVAGAIKPFEMLLFVCRQAILHKIAFCLIGEAVLKYHMVTQSEQEKQKLEGFLYVKGLPEEMTQYSTKPTTWFPQKNEDTSLVKYVFKDVVQQADCMWGSDTWGKTLLPH